MIVISSPVNRCRVSKTHQSMLLQTYQNLHVTISISICTWGSHISFAHNIHKWILWCIYLAVKLYRCDKWKVPSEACVSTWSYHSSGRLCLICKACRKWHLTPNFSLISAWLKKSPFSFRMSFTYFIPFVCQETHSYGTLSTLSIVIYLLFHRVWFCITIWFGLSIVCNSYQKLWISE